MQTTVHQRIILLVQHAGSQEDLSLKAGISRGSISHLVNGKTKPSFEVLSRLASSYPDLNCRWLLTGEGDMFGGASELHKMRLALERLEALSPQ